MERRWRFFKEGGDFTSEGVRVIYAGGKESQRGVALLLDEPTAKRVLSTEAHSDRILTARIQAQPTNIVVIQVYMPTTAHNDEDTEAMHEKVDEHISEVEGTDYLVIMGD